MGWVCDKCKAHNLDDHDFCQMCGTPRPEGAGASVVASDTGVGEGQSWSADQILGAAPVDPASEKVGWRAQQQPSQPTPAGVDPLTIGQGDPAPILRAVAAQRSGSSLQRTAGMLFGSIIIIGGIIYGLSKQYLIARGMQTVGTIVGTQSYPCGRHHYDTCLDYVVRYGGGDARYHETTILHDSRSFHLSSIRYSVGQQLPVYFDPRNPDNATVVYQGSTLDHWGIIPIGIVVLIAGFFTRPKRPTFGGL